METNIKELRKKLGMTQEDLSKKAGVSMVVISQLETGTREVITSETMKKLSLALNEPIENIFLI